MHHPVLEDRLGDHGRAGRHRRQSHHLRLHVGREARERRGAHAERRERARRGVRASSSRRCRSSRRPRAACPAPRRARRSRALERDVATGRRDGRPRTCRSRCGSGMMRCDAPWSAATPSMTMRSVPRARDARPHRDETAGEVDHLRFARRVLRAPSAPRRASPPSSGSRSRSPSPRRTRTGCRRGASPARRCSRARDRSPPPSPAGPHVLVDRPQADRAAAGERHARLAAAGHQRPQREDRCAHRLHELVGCERASRCDPRRVPAGRRRPRTRRHLREQRAHRAHVVQLRTLASRSGSGASSEAQRIGSAAFFAPDTPIVPDRRVPLR